MNTTAWMNKIRTLVHCWVEDHHGALPRVVLADAAQAAIQVCRQAAARLPIVRVTRSGERIVYLTIQAALDAAQTGECIEVPVGIFMEQLTIRRAVTLQGAGQGQTIIQAPCADLLVQSGDGWIDALGRDSFAVVAIRTLTNDSVVIRDVTIDGRDQGYLSAYYAAGRGQAYSFHGVAAWESDVTLEGVTITRIHECDQLQLASTQGVSEAGNSQRHIGMAHHNESIFVESCQQPHTLTLQHTTISNFQQSAVLAWGTHQRVCLSNNVFQGRLATYHTAARMVQLGCDRPECVDLCGVSGVISHNQFIDLGRSWPMSKHRQVHLGEACALALFTAKECAVEGNVLLRKDIPAWLAVALPDGCYAHHGVVLQGKFIGSLRNNEISGFEVAVAEHDVLCATARRRFLQTNDLQRNGKPWVVTYHAGEVVRARQEQLSEMFFW